MSTDGDRLIETVTLSQAKALMQAAAHQQSFLLLSPPGVGKSDMVQQAAREAGLPCRSLLGTQLAPEDVSGVPYIVNERSVFCPPRALLPENPAPFCLFLDELPACTPDIQKAFYSLLLERRLGEHALPEGTWVVAAGNRSQDRALVRTLSSALVNRVIVLNVRVDNDEWLQWAKGANVRREITSYIVDFPSALLRDIPNPPAPFSTPRAWASLSRALELAQAAGVLDSATLKALAQGRVSSVDVDPFCAWWEVLQRANNARHSSLRRILGQPLHELELSSRAVSGLAAAGLNTLHDVLRKTSDELRRLPEFDHARVQEVEEMLARFGLQLGMTIDLP